jgi:UDP-N-acetyl-D-glucosamine dehydrogenase
MPFYPGPGVGGACLPKDPIYLAWKAKLYNFRSRFVELASDITTSMPKHVVERVKDLLKSRKKKLLKGSKVLILGIAYKNDLGDTRDAPAFDVIKLLQKGGAEVIYNDPHVAEISVGNKKYKSVELNNKALKDADIVVIITAHSKYDLGNIVEHATLLFDTRGATWDIAKERTNVVRL